MHILHLEDDMPLREILQIAVCAADPGTQMRQFVSSDEALSYIAQQGDSIDVFVLDIRVPGSVDGMAVAHRIRQMKCTGAIVITSAFQRPSKQVLDTLHAEWMPKPWYLAEFPRKLLSMPRCALAD